MKGERAEGVSIMMSKGGGCESAEVVGDGEQSCTKECEVRRWSTLAVIVAGDAWGSGQCVCCDRGRRRW